MRRAPLLFLLQLGCPAPGGDSVDDTAGELPRDSLPHETGDTAGETEETGDTAPSDPVGLLSLNLHCLKTSGTDFDDNPARFEAIAEVVQAEGIQAIALQELCERPDESASGMLLQALELHTGQSWSLAVAFAHTGWEGTEDEADEYVGLAVQGTIRDERELVYHVQEGLQRVAVAGTWASPLGDLTLVSVHLDHQHDSARLGQARQSAVEALLGPPGAASLVLGDFNAQPGSDSIASLLAMGFEDLGASLDDDRIDFVFAHRGAPVTSQGVRRVFTGADWPEVSDHPGMLAQLEPHEGEPVAITTLSTEYDPGTNFLAVRGSVAPLDWELGWPASRSGERWAAAFTEIEGSFEYKWLLDDSQWQLEDNLQGQAGQDNQGDASF